MSCDIVKENISLEEIIFSQNCEMPNETEHMLADNMPSVARILKASGDVVVTSKSVNGQSVVVEGNSIINIIYVTETGNLCSDTVSIPYSKTFELDKVYEGCYIDVNATCEYINCRALTGRKFEIGFSVILNISVSCICKKQLVSGCESNDIQLKTSKFDTSILVGRAEKNVIIEEELQISDSEPVICCLRSSVYPSVSECRFVSGKIMVKGETKVVLLCLCKNNQTKEFLATIPFSQIMEMESVTESCECDASAVICGYEFRPRTGSDGSFTSMIFSAKICIIAKSTKDIELCYAEDAYSVRGEIKSECNKISAHKNAGKINDKFSINKQLEFSEGTLESVKDVWCEAAKCNTEVENGDLILSGNLRICILGYDNSGAPIYHERPTDYEYRFSVSDKNGATVKYASVTVASCDYNCLGGDRVDVKIGMNVSACLMKSVCTNMINNIELCDDKDSCKYKRDDAAMYIYFAEKGESVWNIAKKYKSPICKLRELNSINEDNIDNEIKLVIPV